MIDRKFDCSLQIIANFLRTRHEGKKHGGYNIYSDEKIEITLDTYYPNLDVRVKTPNGEEMEVYSVSGNGYINIYHPGDWELYCQDILYPRAGEAKKQHEEKLKALKEEEHRMRFSPVTQELNQIFK